MDETPKNESGSGKPEAPKGEPKPVVDVSSTGKADLTKRFLAILIDGMLAGIVGWIIPVVGGLIGAAYMLVRDGLDFDFMPNRSLGKKLMGLRPICMDGSPVDVSVSVKRNVIFAVPMVMMILPVIGWVLMPLVSLVIGIVEIVLVLNSDDGRRWGDKFAETKVIESAD